MEEIFQIVVPQTLRKTVLLVAHDTLLTGHRGVRRTICRVYFNFFGLAFTRMQRLLSIL